MSLEEVKEAQRGKWPSLFNLDNHAFVVGPKPQCDKTPAGIPGLKNSKNGKFYEVGIRISGVIVNPAIVSLVLRKTWWGGDADIKKNSNCAGQVDQDLNSAKWGVLG